jgi:hypothetical protein
MMMRTNTTISRLVVGLIVMTNARAWAQKSEQPKDQSDKPTSKKIAWLHDVYLGEASEYKFFLDEDKRQPLELRREPVMRWTSDNDYHGEVYVWTDHGAAAIVGCTFSGPQGNTNRAIMHEFHSLAAHRLYADARGGTGWLPQEPGIKLEPLADAPVPATTPARRLAQMRDLARRFTAHVQRENSKWEMRLLTQPLYRYEISDERSPVVDGAIFTFVWTAGTDPEVLLILKARRTDKGVQWHYAPARFTNCEAWLQYRGKQVWRAEPASVGIFDGVTSTAYGAFQVKSIPDQSGDKP